ncbi:hypothetical protein [Ornithinimicrobium sp. INDO-MA30-4]|uniref:hypothetical protein n=1 Tax=Ornithinimicrobium sp. INDO-MA30-4 TaxID=2908651 RepID=UPI001F1A58F5|nr:hypothetical protein [Ornithinimicrobium sp. INDO-MA30-4]UJH70448.1 hypothetical protein L0A91_15270 [Ornithinimicrobium sp. INDO-MA30-4]
MSQIQPYTSNSSPALFSRQSREVSRIVNRSELAVIKTAAAAHEADARLDAIDHIAGRAMQGVAMVSQLEQQLAQTVPIAASRLQAVGDIHALASVNELNGFSRRLK